MCKFNRVFFPRLFPLSHALRSLHTEGGDEFRAPLVRRRISRAVFPFKLETVQKRRQANSLTAFDVVLSIFLGCFRIFHCIDSGWPYANMSDSNSDIEDVLLMYMFVKRQGKRRR